MSNITDREYYNSTNISQSKIKLFLDSREEYQDRYILNNRPIDTEALGFGRYYHTLVLQPELLKDKYVIDEGIKVDGMMGIFIEEYAKKENKEAAYTKAGFKLTIEKVWENFGKEENQKYYKFLLTSKGKELINQKDYNKSLYMIDKLNKSCYKTLLEPNDINVETYTELIIEWYVPYVKLPLQSMLDKVVINHTTKTIQILDLKTTKQPTIRRFAYDAKYYKYHIQAAFYKSAVEYKILTEWTNLEDYTIEFIFLPQYTSSPYHTLRPVKLCKDDMDKGYLDYRNALLAIEECMILNIWESDSDLVNLIDGIAEIQLNFNKQYDN